jgi:hypothetical protein
MRPIKARVGPWTATWNRGRLADVQHDEHYSRALACFEVAGWDWGAGVARGPFTPDHLRRQLEAWVDENGAAYAREMPYLR